MYILKLHFVPEKKTENNSEQLLLASIMGDFILGCKIVVYLCLSLLMLHIPYIIVGM